MSESRKKKIFFVMEYGRLRPSGAVRCLQYRDLLARNPEFEAHFTSIQPEGLGLAREFCRRRWFLRPFSRVFRILGKIVGNIREKRIIREAARFDLVYVMKIPSVRLYEGLSALRGPKVVMDLNDGLWLPFHLPDGWGDLDAMISRSDAVFCENSYVAAYVEERKKKAFVVPDAPQLGVFEEWRSRVRRDPDRIVLGWVGSPSSCDTLFAILNPLERLFAKHPSIHLRLLGVDPAKLPRFEKVRFSVLPAYDQEAMVRESLQMDVGLFPLYDLEDSRVRGTLKTMVYMCAGAVPVCQKIGENQKLIQDGRNGFLVSNEEEWFQRLEELVLDSAKRERMSAAALETVRQEFTTEKCLARLLDSFRQVLAD
jgi:glycosyltransferase involved in cell wall biosynthesis